MNPQYVYVPAYNPWSVYGDPVTTVSGVFADWAAGIVFQLGAWLVAPAVWDGHRDGGVQPYDLWLDGLGAELVEPSDSLQPFGLHVAQHYGGDWGLAAWRDDCLRRAGWNGRSAERLRPARRRKQRRVESGISAAAGATLGESVCRSAEPRNPGVEPGLQPFAGRGLQSRSSADQQAQATSRSQQFSRPEGRWLTGRRLMAVVNRVLMEGLGNATADQCSRLIARRRRTFNGTDFAGRNSGLFKAEKEPKSERIPYVWQRREQRAEVQGAEDLRQREELQRWTLRRRWSLQRSRRRQASQIGRVVVPQRQIPIKFISRFLGASPPVVGHGRCGGSAR